MYPRTVKCLLGTIHSIYNRSPLEDWQPCRDYEQTHQEYFSPCTWKLNKEPSAAWTNVRKDWVIKTVFTEFQVNMGHLKKRIITGLPVF